MMDEGDNISTSSLDDGKTCSDVSSLKSAATSQSEKHRSPSPSLFNRLAATETYASLTMKGIVETIEYVVDDDSIKKKTVDPSFFHRMAETETTASLTLKGKTHPSFKNDDELSSSTTTTQRKIDPEFINRLASDTKSSALRRQASAKSASGFSNIAGARPSKHHSRSKSMGEIETPRIAEKETYASLSMKKNFVKNMEKTMTGNKPISPMTDSAFFHRLSESGTYASTTMRWAPQSNESDDRPKTVSSQPHDGIKNMSFFNRMAEAETVASKSWRKNKDEGTVKSTSGESLTLGRRQDIPLESFGATRSHLLNLRTPRLPSDPPEYNSSLYDRLAGTDTLASLSLKKKEKDDVNDDDDNSTTRSTTMSQQGSPTRRTSPSFYDRMYKSETFSSVQRKSPKRTKKQKNVWKGSPMKKDQRTSPSFFDNLSAADTFSFSQSKLTKKCP